MDWDDFRFLHAFAAGETLAHAARTLRVDPSTVSRRLQQLESALETRLFLRTPDGLELTAEGRRAAACAATMFDAVDGLTESISGGDARPGGVVRVTCADAFSPVVVRALADLRERHEALRVELVTDNRTIDLRRREADIAVRMYRDERAGLVMRKLGTIGWSLYASPAYLAARGELASPAARSIAGHDIVGYDDSIAKAPGAEWLARAARPADVVFRGGSPRAVLEAVKSGLGVSAIPCWLTRGEPVVRLTPEVVVATEVFAVYAPELRAVHRVQVVVGQLAQWFKLERAWLGGAIESR